MRGNGCNWFENSLEIETQKANYKQVKAAGCNWFENSLEIETQLSAYVGAMPE